ncbi:helix-turn-helix domain-containing protein [Glutamicibacter protophormiae]|uniref:helix-turn-helix domain-containing protein n=1 Tax=Glutamicibacter protophormiae TaxID=37930 RepID=UPI001958A9EA|nr:helix-turn-helix domain-containing protein [Glutamicibacter protophormiae]QRQ79190.1 helix-turn-helix domain-containing protein [Glutamicibacter protophormiae]
MDNVSTLEIKGFTPYAQIPRWILRAGDKLSHGAVRLYGVIMTYADNSTRAAFPSREKLAEDLGVTPRSISTYTKELEDFKALEVTRRRNKKTGNFYANHYVLVFTEPGAEICTPPDEADDPITRPTTKLDPPSFTSEDESSNDIKELHAQTSLPHDTKGSITPKQRYELRSVIKEVGVQLKNGKKFYDDDVQDTWWTFIGMMEDAFKDDFDNTGMADLLHNGKWTVSAKVADPYEAGKELNKIIATSYTT